MACAVTYPNAFSVPELAEGVNDFNFDEALGLFAGLNVIRFMAAYWYAQLQEHSQVWWKPKVAECFNIIDFFIG